jgi:hypothetical protein
LAASAALAAAAYEVHDHFRATRRQPVESTVAIATKAAIAPEPAVVPEEVATPPVVEPAPTEPPVQQLSKAEAIRAELVLLRQARADVARKDFVAALRPIIEHTHRFKNGRLVEEREALRVQALAGLGRTEEARQAASAFRARFPRSVLLPAVSRMLDSTP